MATTPKARMSPRPRAAPHSGTVTGQSIISRRSWLTRITELSPAVVITSPAGSRTRNPPIMGDIP